MHNTVFVNIDVICILSVVLCFFYTSWLHFLVACFMITFKLF